MRKIPLKLKQLQILEQRSTLGETEEKEKEKLSRGYAGELEFDKILDAYVSGLDVYHLKDFRFKNDDSRDLTKVVSGSSEVQIDNVLAAGDRIYTFEVKNFAFDLIYGSKNWHFTGGSEYKDLSMQVNRQRSSLNFLIRDGGFNYEVISHLVFVNPQQTIYNMPNLENLIVPSNMGRRLAKICVSNRYDQSSVVDYLDSRRLVKSMYDLPANVSFEALRCGVFCYRCDSTAELERVNPYKYCCSSCTKEFTVLEVILVLIDELKTLNESWEVSPARISAFSGGAVSSSTIRRYKRDGRILL